MGFNLARKHLIDSAQTASLGRLFQRGITLTSGFRVKRHVLLYMGFLSIAFSRVSRNCKEPELSYH